MLYLLVTSFSNCFNGYRLPDQLAINASAAIFNCAFAATIFSVAVIFHLFSSKNDQVQSIWFCFLANDNAQLHFDYILCIEVRIINSGLNWMLHNDSRFLDFILFLTRCECKKKNIARNI